MGALSQRIEVIDVLRGFALAGILLVHTSGEFAGWSTTYSSAYKAASLPTASIDSGVNFVVSLFLINKSRALFAFLFGIGFFFQLGTAEKSGYRIEGNFAKRMGFLFLIGALHAYLLWAGDILRLYAVCGLLLLLVFRWKPKALFITACICTILIPALSSVVHLYFPSGVLDNYARQLMYKGYAGDTYGGLLHANLLRDVSVNLDPYSIGMYLIPIWGNFIFGLWAAQTSLIQKLMGNKMRLLTCVLISGATGMLASNNFVRLIARIMHIEESEIGIAWRSILSVPAAYSIEATAFFLFCLVIYLYEYTFCQKWLSFFTYAGRMTLTNYIMQSVFAIVFFFGVGFGFISHFGAFAAFCIGVLFFVVQLLYSYVWLHYFTTGPVEYLWRSMIAGKWQTIRKQKLIAS